ncbi:NAD(P)-binding protein [Hypoxylon sp. EC38]|nr:NAD(P)-binding protein [Hypoxylon sp. EC38]
MANPTVILITGVSKGIGLRIAEICLDRPNHVVIGSIRDDTTQAVAELKKRAPAEGSKLLLVHIESTSPEDPKKAAAVVEAAGIDHVDIIIANAGASPFPVLPIETIPNADLVWAFQANAAGPLGLFQAFRHLLQKSKSPKWASITSTVSFTRPSLPADWLIELVRALAYSQQEWLTVIDIHPGHARTEPGNWIAKQIGLEEAPLTIDESAKAVLKTVETTTREAALGKLIHAVDGSVLPW